jgi:hypothetical protein
VLDAGGYIAVTLVIIEVILVFFFAFGKTTKAAFVMASFAIMFLAAFFWMGNRVTEITIASIGTIKTAANVATQYVEEIKNIKADAERQKKDVNAAVEALTKEIDQARAQTRTLTERMAARALNSEQMQQIADKLKPYAGQEFQIVTYWEMKEPLALANQIYMSLQLAGWKFIKPQSATFMLGGTEGVEVWRHPNADERVQKAADALVAALNNAHLDAVLKLENPTNNPVHNKISLNVGTKPGFP